jgi:hypothetical protein
MFILLRLWRVRGRICSDPGPDLVYLRVPSVVCLCRVGHPTMAIIATIGVKATRLALHFSSQYTYCFVALFVVSPDEGGCPHIILPYRRLGLFCVVQIFEI